MIQSFIYRRWGGYHCDRLLSRQDSIQISSVPTVQIIPTSNKSANSSKSDAKITQCNEWLSKYAVVVGSTWGQAPLEIQKQWTILGCDAIILPAPGDHYPMSSCFPPHYVSCTCILKEVGQWMPRTKSPI
jgi:hypothetical protein